MRDIAALHRPGPQRAGRLYRLQAWGRESKAASSSTTTVRNTTTTVKSATTTTVPKVAIDQATRGVVPPNDPTCQY